jgi:hypothetical protein
MIVLLRVFQPLKNDSQTSCGSNLLFRRWKARGFAHPDARSVLLHQTGEMTNDEPLHTTGQNEQQTSFDK